MRAIVIAVCSFAGGIIGVAVINVLSGDYSPLYKATASAMAMAGFMLAVYFIRLVKRR